MGLLNTHRTRVDLNGSWQRYIQGQLFDVIAVPSSLRPSGVYRLKRNFLLPHLSNGQRAILHFDAITYYGKVFVNGHELGSAIPYVPQEFEFTQQAVEGRNTVEIEISDAHSEPGGAGTDEIQFGSPGGWECYGGIIRPVYVDLREVAFIDNVRFAYQLSRGYNSASCKAQILVASADARPAVCTLSLWSGDSEVAQVTKAVQLKAGMVEVEVTFEFIRPALWSPQEPNLYELRARLEAGPSSDEWACLTGFRELKAEGRNFVLNGTRLVLNGVCRHDMWKDQGFTLSPSQQEQDMRMIKALGCNFVRLVHYPHDRRIVELADRLGLLISEEPGFWNVDFQTAPAGQIALGYKILESTIRRDWNSPSVAIWFLGSGCTHSVSYLKHAKRVCDSVDPIQRLVSVSHIFGEFPAVKTSYDEAGLDFYDYHAYAFSSDKFLKLPASFGPDKPLTVSEWGWEDAGNGAVVYERNPDELLDQVEGGRIAGGAFWSWNDVPQFNRVDWSTHDGIVRSGIVTESRELREPIYSRLAAFLAGRREYPHTSGPAHPTIVPLRWIPFSPGSTFHPLDLQPWVDSVPGQQSWRELENSLEKFWANNHMARGQWRRTGSQFELWPDRELQIAGVTFRSPSIGSCVRPIVLTPESPEAIIPVNHTCIRLHILGQVSLPLGYPIAGNLGETVAIYTLQYASGKTQTIPVRSGIEVAQSNCIYQATRIDPIATAAQPAVEYVKDIAREQYQILLWSVPTESARLVSLHCTLTGQQPALAIFAITCEQNPDIGRS